MVRILLVLVVVSLLFNGLTFLLVAHGAKSQGAPATAAAPARSATGPEGNQSAKDVLDRLGRLEATLTRMASKVDALAARPAAPSPFAAPGAASPRSLRVRPVVPQPSAIPTSPATASETVGESAPEGAESPVQEPAGTDGAGAGGEKTEKSEQPADASGTGDGGTAGGGA